MLPQLITREEDAVFKSKINTMPCWIKWHENSYTLTEKLNNNESTTEDTTDQFQMIPCLIAYFKHTVWFLTFEMECISQMAYCSV